MKAATIMLHPFLLMYGFSLPLKRTMWNTSHSDCVYITGNQINEKARNMAIRANTFLGLKGNKTYWLSNFENRFKYLSNKLEFAIDKLLVNNNKLE